MCGYENELFMERCVCNLHLLRIPLWCTYEQHNWIPMHSSLSSHVVHILQTLHTRVKYYVQIICIYIYTYIYVCVSLLPGAKTRAVAWDGEENVRFEWKAPWSCTSMWRHFKHVYHIISVQTITIINKYGCGPCVNTSLNCFEVILIVPLFGSIVVPGPDRDQPIQLAPISSFHSFQFVPLFSFGMPSVLPS